MWNRKCEVHDEHILNINRLESKVQEAQQQMRTIVREPAECEEGGSWALESDDDTLSLMMMMMI
jgi:hypothetical protein